MTKSTLPVLLVLYLFLAGCAGIAGDNGNGNVLPPKTQYDAIITDDRGKRLSINQLAARMADADLVVIGEFHGHHASHLLQTLVQSALYRHRPQQVLSMEQFELIAQPVLDSYLKGDSGEAEMMEDANAWHNYAGSYRPQVEFAKTHGLPVVAANAPGDVVRCVGRQGIEYLAQLSEPNRHSLPDLPLVSTQAYQEKFFSTMSHGHGHGALNPDVNERLNNSYQAQLLRDNTMAQQIIQALDANPHAQILHLTGTFHAESHLGTVAVVKKQRPDLSVVVLSPVIWHPGDTFDELVKSHRGKGDYLYLIQPLPTEYADTERHREAIMAQFREAAENRCE